MGPPADIEKETADVNRKVAVLLSRFSIELRDPTTYEEALAPLLKRLGQPLGTSAFGFASAYKEAGNALFKQGQHAWALHTYLVGTSLLERLGRSSAADAKVVEAEDDPELRPVFLASYSNAALMALKLQCSPLASQLCERALRLEPEGAELAKLLHRKAQAAMERAESEGGADPAEAVELLVAANEAHSSRPVLELLQKARAAKKAAERAAQKEADSGLFGGKGFGSGGLSGGRVGKDAISRADAVNECYELQRRGMAALLGTTPDRTIDPYRKVQQERKGEAPDKVDGVAAAAAFASAARLAKEAGLADEEARALFGLGAAASENREWAECAKRFKEYFGAAARLPSSFKEPHLGETYARLHYGLALYEMQDVEAAAEGLEAYLAAKAAYPTVSEAKVCHVDSLGIETHPDLEKSELQSRRWAVGGRAEFMARRRLAHLCQLSASSDGQPDPVGGLKKAIEQLTLSRKLAWDDKQRAEIDSELEKTEKVLEIARDHV